MEFDGGLSRWLLCLVVFSGKVGLFALFCFFAEFYFLLFGSLLCLSMATSIMAVKMLCG